MLIEINDGVREDKADEGVSAPISSRVDCAADGRPIFRTTSHVAVARNRSHNWHRGGQDLRPSRVNFLILVLINVVSLKAAAQLSDTPLPGTLNDLGSGLRRDLRGKGRFPAHRFLICMRPQR